MDDHRDKRQHRKSRHDVHDNQDPHDCRNNGMIDEILSSNREPLPPTHLAFTKSSGLDFHVNVENAAPEEKQIECVKQHGSPVDHPGERIIRARSAERESRDGKKVRDNRL